MVWGMISFRALSELHVVPQNQTVTADNYVQEILEKTCSDAMNRRLLRDKILTRRLLPDMSTVVFMQDGAPAHTARVTQQWCRDNLRSFWAKEEWPGNSPDLNPIEHLWSILQVEYNKLLPATTIRMLTRNMKMAWSRISPQILENLVNSMPKRMKDVITMNIQRIEK